MVAVGQRFTTGHLANDTLAESLRNGLFVAANCVAIEMIASYGMPVGKEVFATCYYIGALMEICRTWKVRVMPVYRKDVKLALCGSPRAKDANVRQALIDLLGAPGTKKEPGRYLRDQRARVVSAGHRLVRQDPAYDPIVTRTGRETVRRCCASASTWRCLQQRRAQLDKGGDWPWPELIGQWQMDQWNKETAEAAGCTA